MVYSINEIVKYLQVIYYGLVINNINLKCNRELQSREMLYRKSLIHFVVKKCISVGWYLFELNVTSF